MKSLDDLLSRYEVPKSYRQEPIAQDTIYTLIQSARQVRGAFHLEPTHYFIITDEEEKAKVCSACFKMPLVRKAPCIVVFTGDRFAVKDHEAILDQELEDNSISVDEAERLRQAVSFHFDTSPIGIGWIAKCLGAPLMRLFTSMPRMPAVHKREWLTNQVMRTCMTCFWAAISHNLSPRLVDSFDEWRLKWALSIPWHHVVVSVMLVGYAEESVLLKPKLTLDDIVHWKK